MTHVYNDMINVYCCASINALHDHVQLSFDDKRPGIGCTKGGYKSMIRSMHVFAKHSFTYTKSGESPILNRAIKCQSHALSPQVYSKQQMARRFASLSIQYRLY